jgi:hypothetical protein
LGRSNALAFAWIPHHRRAAGNAVKEPMDNQPILQPVKATYCQEMTDGTIIRLSCYFDPFTLDVTDIATDESDSDSDSENFTEREYLELPDGTEIDTFNDADSGRVIADGTMQDESSSLSALDYVMGTNKTDD